MTAPVHGDSSTPQGTREDTRIPRAPSRLADPNGAVADLVEDVCRAHGGAKALTIDVDLSYSQIRRMAGDGGIPNLAQILLFIEHAGPRHPFRAALVAHLEGMFDRTTEQIATEVSARVAKGEPIADAVQEVLGLVQIYPGRWARIR